MSTNQVTNARRREALLALLTDVEVSKVSRAEGSPRLVEGDEYVDLHDVASGVHLVQATSDAQPGRALPRSAVSEATWKAIVHLVSE
jgi:hypothetical protein